MQLQEIFISKRAADSALYKSNPGMSLVVEVSLEISKGTWKISLEVRAPKQSGLAAYVAVPDLRSYSRPRITV